MRPIYNRLLVPPQFAPFLHWRGRLPARPLEPFANQEAEGGEAEKGEFPDVVGLGSGWLADATLQGAGALREGKPMRCVRRRDLEKKGKGQKELHWNKVLASLLTSVARVLFCDLPDSAGLRHGESNRGEDQYRIEIDVLSAGQDGCSCHTFL